MFCEDTVTLTKLSFSPSCCCAKFVEILSRTPEILFMRNGRSDKKDKAFSWGAAMTYGIR